MRESTEEKHAAELAVANRRTDAANRRANVLQAQLHAIRKAVGPLLDTLSSTVGENQPDNSALGRPMMHFVSFRPNPARRSYTLRWGETSIDMGLNHQNERLIAVYMALKLAFEQAEDPGAAFQASQLQEVVAGYMWNINHKDDPSRHKYVPMDEIGEVLATTPPELDESVEAWADFLYGTKHLMLHDDLVMS